MNGTWPFVVWTLGYPVTCAIERWVMWRIGDREGITSGVKATAAFLNLGIWVGVGWQLWPH